MPSAGSFFATGVVFVANYKHGSTAARKISEIRAMDNEIAAIMWHQAKISMISKMVTKGLN